MEHENDFYWHALNYRTAFVTEAHEMWQELEACMNRLIAAEREACAVTCEQQLGFIAECPEMATYCAEAIRMRSNV